MSSSPNARVRECSRYVTRYQGFPCGLHEFVHFLHLIFDYLSWEQTVAVEIEIPWEQTRIMRIRSRNTFPRSPRNGEENFKTQNKNKRGG